MHRKPTQRWLMAALGLAALALLAGGAWFYRTQEQALRREAEANLTAIAGLKVDQIVQWRSAQLANAAVLTESSSFIAAVERWMAAPQAGDTAQILARFRTWQEHYGYGDVLLADAGGQVRLSLSGYVGPLHDDAVQTLAAAYALAGRRPALSDLHVGPGDLWPHIDAIAPLLADNTEGSEPLGAVILQSDARRFLYPLIQSWPVPSDSAETLLVRRDGDHVLYLNDLRFQEGAALTLRIPLDRIDVPAVMAVLGREGVVQGRDYRGVDVLSVLKAVPDSPWFQVAKVDAAEALSVWRRESALIVALLLGLVLATAVGVAGVWQRNAKAQYRGLYQAETARLNAEQRYRVTLMSVADGVIAADAEGRVELLNPVAEALTGWSQAEARGKPLAEVFCIVNEETRRPVEDPASRVLREGHLVGLANRTVLIARDGTERPIADSGAPIRGEQGEISGVALVFRDQAEERAAQKALRESEEQYRLLAETTPDIILLHDMEGRIRYVNKAGLDFASFGRSEAVGKSITAFIPSEHLAGITARREQRVAGGAQVHRHETEFVDRAGHRVPVEVHSTPILREGKVAEILVVAHDITERKQAEERVRMFAAGLEQRVEERTRQLSDAQEKLVRQERLAVLGQLAGGVGHELRNPLGIISNAVYYLKLVLPDAGAKIAEYLAIVENETRNAAKIVADLLDFARVKSADPEPVSVAGLAARTLGRYPAPEGISVTLNFPETLPTLHVDLCQMTQVLGNLVVNACQAMPHGGSLTISAVERGEEMAIAVADTGEGIAPENMARIFEPLFTTRARGIGLGLAVCKALVEANGGRIEAHSEPGQGATFTIYLPTSQAN